MSEPISENADEGVGQADEVVRRFDSRKNVRQARKNGIKFDKDRGSGIPATTTNIEPVNPDRIKDVTGARNADAWMDIDINLNSDSEVVRES